MLDGTSASILASSSSLPGSIPNVSTTTVRNLPTKEKVKRVVDGDTIDTSLGRVRLLGVNTPEKNMPFYQEAKDYLKQYEGKNIELEQDKEDKDKYGRELRFIFYNDAMINLQILRLGLATYYSYGSKYDKKLLEAEDFARVGELGLWKKSKNKCANCVILVSLDNGKEKDDCLAGSEEVKFRNICGFSCDLDGWIMKDDANHIFNFNNYEIILVKINNETALFCILYFTRYFATDIITLLIINHKL